MQPKKEEASGATGTRPSFITDAHIARYEADRQQWLNTLKGFENMEASRFPKDAFYAGRWLEEELLSFGASKVEIFPVAMAYGQRALVGDKDTDVWAVAQDAVERFKSRSQERQKSGGKNSAHELAQGIQDILHVMGIEGEVVFQPKREVPRG